MNKDAEKVIEAVKESCKHLENCVLCGRTTYQRELYCPNNSQAVGAPKGKHRYFIAAVCENHPKNEETANAVERYIESIYGRLQ